MPRHLRFLLWVSVVAVCAMITVSSAARAAAAMSPEDAWKALPKYEYGQDMTALLTIDGEVIRAMATPASRAACAAHLAAVLQASETTPAAKQYACLQLRQVGTAAEVPLLAQLLAKPETSQMARYALESIPGAESLAALRAGLGSLQGELLRGVINSVAARKDAGSVARLIELSADKDPKVAAAAFWALGCIASPEAITSVADRVRQADVPTPNDVAVPGLRCAAALVAGGSPEQARSLYEKLSQTGQATGTRRAALEGLLRLQQDRAEAIVMAWVDSGDADRRSVAMGHLASLSEKEIEGLVARFAELPEAQQLVVLQIFGPRLGQKSLPLLMSAAKSDRPKLRLAAIRGLGTAAERSAIPLLVDSLAAGGELTEAAERSLCALPREAVGGALLDALRRRADVRAPAIEVLKRLKYYEAIDPLVAMAAGTDAKATKEALDGLRGIADPDDTDISRLVKLLLTVEGERREEVERTILIVCEKVPAGTDRVQPVLAVLAKVAPSASPTYLPLLGRLGGPKAAQMIDAALKSSEPAVKDAAVRGLCNWPSAEVAPRLWDLASHSDNKTYRQWALRAYVRVITLKSDRPEAQTFGMLKQAMQLAERPEEKHWILSRAATVRTMETVTWVAGYLDDPALAQTACRTIVALAHHRFLRHPNMDRFRPLLEKVIRTSADRTLVERAEKYRLGL
jgi:HEAT repeat protein